MPDRYRDDLKAHVTTDDQGVVRQIVHSGEYWLPDEQNPRRAAVEYVRAQAGLLEFDASSLDRLEERVSYSEPLEEGNSYRLAEDKRQFDSATIAFAQTYLNVPVWRTGVTATVKGEPSRIVESTNTTMPDVRAELPSDEAIARWRDLIGLTERRVAARVGEEAPAVTPADRMVRDALGLTRERARSDEGLSAVVRSAASMRVNRGRFFVYRYEPEQRQPPQVSSTDKVLDLESNDVEPTFELPPVPDTIEPGRDYVVCEVVFTLPFGGIQQLNWRGLFEVETNAVLWLRALISGVNGLVFTLDPITSTGVLTNTADQPNATLDPLRDDVILGDLNGPVAGNQSLAGANVVVSDDDLPAIVPPTEATGTDFDYVARTNNFAAVSAYYHANDFFRVVEDLGFSLATYFDGTAFPIHVDHRASFGDPGGIEINAFCGGDAQGDGIGLVGYCLSHLADVANPLGRAVDKYVHWHEIGGHGILWDHVESPNFGFAHSAGDGLAGIQSDPESVLRELGLVERFRYTPFRPIRWMNRDVTTGWGWGGTNDVGGYSSEEILATTHFQIYRSIGGDSTSLGRRQFASRVVTYLILRAVGGLTPMNNPATALAWCNTLIATDKLDWTSEGMTGGAYNKVIRWSFERQGLFQAPGAPVPVTMPGAPPDVDVYIDDGRGGEYRYQPVHWNNTSIWNRNAADGLTAHQAAIEGQTNYAYVKVKNRGTLAAANVTVKGYHSLPGAGLTWPTDFTGMSPAGGRTAASIPPNNSGEVTLGPFEWVPNVNAYGHDCVLMIASVSGDPSNVDLLGPGETIAEWRLVPNDNNVGQRNVQLVPGGGGGEGLLTGLDGRMFFAGNTFLRRAKMQLQVDLPQLLRAAGWQVRFPGVAGNRFVLGPGAKRLITVELVPGRDFTTDDVERTDDRDITITLLADGMVLGGMSYRLDPTLKRPPDHVVDRDCRDRARDLLRCLDMPGAKVRDVRVRKVSIDVCLDDECC